MCFATSSKLVERKIIENDRKRSKTKKKKTPLTKRLYAVLDRVEHGAILRRNGMRGVVTVAAVAVAVTVAVAVAVAVTVAVAVAVAVIVGAGC